MADLLHWMLVGMEADTVHDRLDEQTPDWGPRARELARTVPACGPFDTLSAAAQTLWMGRLACVPVVQTGAGGAVLVGMLTGHDVHRAASRHCRPLHALRVAEAMTCDPVTGHVDDVLEDTLDVFRRHAQSRLPLVDGSGRFFGLLLLEDVLEAVADGHRAARAYAQRRV